MYRFYWYPKCSTCKKAKAWLDAHHVDYQVIDMIASPPSEEMITDWLEHNEIPLRRLFQYEWHEVSGNGAKRPSG